MAFYSPGIYSETFTLAFAAVLIFNSVYSSASLAKLQMLLLFSPPAKVWRNDPDKPSEKEQCDNILVYANFIWYGYDRLLMHYGR